MKKLLPLPLFFFSLVYAQPPDWVEIEEKSSIYVDLNSRENHLSEDHVINIDLVLNLPLPKEHPDYKELASIYGLDPISFVSNISIHCDTKAIYRNTDGVAYGSFISMRKNAQGKPYHPMKKGDLVQFKTLKEPSVFSGVAESDKTVEKLVMLVCSNDMH